MMIMSLLQIPDSIYIGVTDALAASLWYKEKLGLRQVVAPTSDAGDCVSLAFSERDETAIILGPRDSTSDQRPILYATNIGKAKDQLSSRGVSVTPIESDRQGTHYFVMRDLEGNQIEVTEEP
jgi:catechol 2,3-dioxygenase-like lactoylglutathione lyase family enzyme